MDSPPPLPTSGPPADDPRTGADADADAANPFQDRYDDAMFDFTTEQYDAAIAKLDAILAEDPAHFDARLALGMAWYRKGDFPRAIEEGHRAEKLRPSEQLVHTNLSLFYMKSGDKKTAEYHGLQARIASWRGNMDKPPAGPANPADPADPELRMAEAPPPPRQTPHPVPRNALEEKGRPRPRPRPHLQLQLHP